MSSVKLLQKSLILWTNLRLAKWEQGSHRNKECFFVAYCNQRQGLMGRCSSCHAMWMTSHVGEATHHCSGLFSSRTTSPLLDSSFYEQCRTLWTQPCLFLFLTGFVSLRQSQTDFCFVLFSKSKFLMCD